MPAKKSLIVFDIDGTLTDSVALHQTGFIYALQTLGVTAMDENFHSYKHHTDLHIARTIYESATNRHFGPDTIALFEDHLYNSIAAAKDMQEIKGARQFVTYLEQETAYGVCYATGSMQRPAQFKLEKAGIGFDARQLVASNHAEERASIVQAAIDKALLYYNVTRFDRVIAFGDGLWDLKTAQQLNLEFVGIGAKNKQLMEAAGMLWHMDDFSAGNFAFLN